MKAEFELIIDDNFDVCIKFKHHDKDISNDQMLLKKLIKGFIDNGIEIKRIGSFAEMGTNISFDTYELRIKNRQQEKLLKYFIMSLGDIIKNNQGIKVAKAFNDMYGTHTVYLLGNNGKIVFKLSCKKWLKNFNISFENP